MTIFYVFWDEESENRIRFHPIHLDFAVPEVASFSLQRNPAKLFSGNKWPYSFDHYYVFLDEECDSRIRFYPSRPDFAAPDETIF